ncbi:DUF447 domain-containing protein [Chelatococcus sp. GCM10030263]|uniref:DUF447 domain-containing protein n=1 Tax=Chelatococcus sp. GCM10030263 TaxID=3273387 RepID=UPI0036175BB3
MAFILETVVTTRNADGSHHLAPYGLIQDGEGYVIAPFHPSPAIENLRRRPFAAAAAPVDLRVIAGAVTGRRDWPTVACETIDLVRLADAFGHMELAVESVTEDALRPRFRCKVVHSASHLPFVGYNRAQAAIIEGAILSTRLDLLPREKIEAEMAYLRIAISKTAGPVEQEAWGWIEEKIRDGLGS